MKEDVWHLYGAAGAAGRRRDCEPDKGADAAGEREPCEWAGADRDREPAGGEPCERAGADREREPCEWAGADRNREPGGGEPCERSGADREREPGDGESDTEAGAAGAPEDGELVRRAQSGDREAFGELIRRHRAKVYGYAQSIAAERFAAEDIVQDALLRAFMHLGTLVDAARFLPWLHRIVRNQAYSRLRSRASREERTFSSLRAAADRSAADEDWSSLDAILHRLSRSAALDAAEGDPEEVLMRREMLRTITGLLQCLHERERRVFEAHFFDNLPPREIAKLFSLSQANVYQIISRSRKKVVQERIRHVIDQYIRTRKDLGTMKKVALVLDEELKRVGSWISVGAALYGVLQYTNRKLSLPMTMGLTGHAFRITILSPDVHIAGPTSYDFAGVLSRGLRNIGFDACSVNGLSSKPGTNASLADPALLTLDAMEKRQLHSALPEALDLIHRSLDKGYPVIAWDLFMPEFSLIYGYDDEKRELLVLDMGQLKTLPYSHLGRGFLEDLFVLSVEEGTSTVEPAESFSQALAIILAHYYGEERGKEFEIGGLAAYDAWRDAFRGGAVEPNGNAYNVAVIREARQHAAAFLREMADVLRGELGPADKVAALTLEAAEHYERMAAPFDELHRMFPFPQGGSPNEPEQASHAIRLLETVQALERQAAGLLRDIFERLSKHEAGQAF